MTLDPDLAVRPRIVEEDKSGADATGTDPTGVAQPAGGAGIRGWLGGIFSRLAPGEAALGLPTLNTAFVDSAAVATSGSKKTLYLVVTTALTWVTSGQPTFRPYAGRVSMAAAGGATSQIDANHVALGTAQNLGPAAATTLAIGTYRLSAGSVAELQWPDPYIGIELNFPSALTGGVATAYVESGT